MRPLPRVHAFTDAALLAAPEFGIRAAAIAAGGPAVALHARARGSGGALLAAGARRIMALARPPEAAVFVSGRPDLAAALLADGVQLGSDDLTPGDARRVFPHGWIGRSVTDVEEAKAAVDQGADFLVVGSVYDDDIPPPRTGRRAPGDQGRGARPASGRHRGDHSRTGGRGPSRRRVRRGGHTGTLAGSRSRRGHSCDALALGG